MCRVWNRISKHAPGVLQRRVPPEIRNALDLSFDHSSAIIKSGWSKSRTLGLPVDAEGMALPWYTYPAIRFLETRLPSGLSVFEYGMGNSTLWWSKRATFVESCEHDEKWFNCIKGNLPANVLAHLHPVNSNSYINALAEANHKVDILVIDGRRRVSCARTATQVLTTQSVIIWDNSDREYYEPGFKELLDHGFTGRIDFWGMGPINLYEWCTSIFYGADNCLGL